MCVETEREREREREITELPSHGPLIVRPSLYTPQYRLGKLHRVPR